MEDGANAVDTPRWRDLGDSRDLAAAVRSAYQASPRPSPASALRSGTEPAAPNAAGELDALSLLRSSTPSRRGHTMSRHTMSRHTMSRRLVAAIGGTALVLAAAVVPVALLTSGRFAPPVAPVDLPALDAGSAATPSTATTAAEPWTYEPAPPPPETSSTTAAPPTAGAPHTTTARARPRRTTTTRATPSGGSPGSSPPTTSAPPPANDEPESGSGW